MALNLTRKPRKWQRKVLAANITTNNTNFLEFTGLTIGKTYSYKYFVSWFFDSNSTLQVDVVKDTSTALVSLLKNFTSSQGSDFFSGEYLFVADANNIKLRVSNLTGSDVIFGGALEGGSRTSYATLEEEQDLELVTEFGA